MTNIREVLAANIKTFRNEMGLTQSKLAEKVNTATHYIAMIEGCKNYPSPEMLERIAAALDKDTVDLFAITPIQHDWKEIILSDIEKLVINRIEELGNKSKKRSKKNTKTTDI